MIFAAAKGHTEIVAALLAKGADPTLESRQRRHGTDAGAKAGPFRGRAVASVRDGSLDGSS